MEDWGPEHERVLAEWGDKSNCYNWLHTKCHEKFHSLHIWYTVPVIIMSTLTGTANFAQSKIPASFQGYSTMIIGAVNITAGIITTVQQFLKINELNEGHRVASIGWDKFYRKIKVELSKKPNERASVNEFFKACTDEYDRLMESSPSIEEDILALFEKTFEKTFVDGFEKPEICNSLISVKNIIYKKTDEDKKKQHDAFALIETNIAEMIQFEASLKCEISKTNIEIKNHDGEKHSDIKASFKVICQKSPTGTTITFHFQKTFPKLKEVNVQLVADDLQKSFKANKDGSKLVLKK
jgi:hypothetical protein